MKPVFNHPARRLALALSLLLAIPVIVKAQDPQASPSPLDEKARQRAEKEAKKVAEQEEKAARTAAEKERREAEALAKKRDRTAPRAEETAATSNAGAESQAASAPTDREQARLQRAEEKARAEADKARKKEEDRARAQEAKDAERRRKDEDRALREAAKAREADDKARAAALKKEQEEADKAARRDRGKTGEPIVTDESATQPAVGEPPVMSSKEEEKRRKELVKQIEKARAERDRLNREADESEGLARTARAAASEGQRVYEALTTGLDVEDVAPPATPAEEAPKRSRFVTKADEKLAAAPRNGGQAADPLRIALDLKKPDPEERERAAFALASLGPEALPATRALMAALADPNPTVRIAAAQALGRIGPGASLAIAPLSAALTDPDPAVKNAAQSALIAIQGR